MVNNLYFLYVLLLLEDYYMGLIGILLVVASLAIAVYIIMDTYLGAPPKPKTLLVFIVIAILGGSLIFIDYHTQPEVHHAELSTSDIEFTYKDRSNRLGRPIKMKFKKNLYPWYSIFHRTRTDIEIINVEKSENEENEE